MSAGKNTILREFGLTTWALKHAKVVVLLTWFALITGFWLYQNLPRESFPDVSFPEVYVTIQYPGFTPEDIERMITRKVEKELKQIEGVKEVRSVVKTGVSMTVAKFSYDYDMDDAYDRVKEKVDELYGSGELPADLPRRPTVMKLDISEVRPAMQVNLFGNYDPAQLRQWAEELKDRIEVLKEVSSVDIVGVEDREVAVLVDVAALAAHHIPIMQVVQVIRSANYAVSAGLMRNNGVVLPLRVAGDVQSLQELENIVVRQTPNGVIRLKDVAEVRFQLEEPESFARLYGKPVAMLVVKKRKGANLIKLSEKVQQIIDEFRTQIPEDVNIAITGDLSEHTIHQVSNLENNIIAGLILVLLIMTLFMGFRNAVYVALAIPFSMLFAFIVLYVSGITLNTPVLFALVLALGMLVDNGIVIVENVLKYREQGYDLFSAVRYGVGEVAVPIITSTATTVAAFIPLAFWPGLVGKFLYYLPITLIAVLAGSLLVALVVNPVFIARYSGLREKLGVNEMDHRVRWAFWTVLLVVGLAGIGLYVAGQLPSSNYLLPVAILLVVISISVMLYRWQLYKVVDWFQKQALVWLEERYAATLAKVLTIKGALGIVAMAFLLLVLGAVGIAIRKPVVHFFPDADPDQGYVFIELPEGTDIHITDTFTRQVAQRIYTLIRQKGYDTLGVTSVIEQVGKGAFDPTKGIQPGRMENRAKITIDFSLDRFQKGLLAKDVLQEVQAVLPHRAGVDIYLGKREHKPPMGYPISLELYGDNYDQLYAFARHLKHYFDSLHIPGLLPLQMDVTRRTPRLTALIQRHLTDIYGLSVRDIGLTLRTAIYGTEAGELHLYGDDYPINVRLQKPERYQFGALGQLLVPTMDRQSLLPLSAVVSFQHEEDFNAIYRKNQKRYILLYANVAPGGYGAPQIIQLMQKHLREHVRVPAGITYRFTGEQEEMKKNIDYLSKAMLIALFLILMILILEFNSYLQPFIILTTVVLSAIGVLWGWAISGADIVILMMMIGMISLAGIVVNNAIVLVDYTNLTIQRLLKERNQTTADRALVREALVHAGKMRLRPVLLTAITTILGMLPLAIGLNIDFVGLLTRLQPNIYLGGFSYAFWGPLAQTVIYGLCFATVLTLVVVPALYYLLWRGGEA